MNNGMKKWTAAIADVFIAIGSILAFLGLGGVEALGDPVGTTVVGIFLLVWALAIVGTLSVVFPNHDERR